jgi:hypothetical protein
LISVGSVTTNLLNVGAAPALAGAATLHATLDAVSAAQQPMDLAVTFNDAADAGTATIAPEPHAAATATPTRVPRRRTRPEWGRTLTCLNIA